MTAGTHPEESRAVSSLTSGLLVLALLLVVFWPRRRIRLDQVHRVSAEDLWSIAAPHPSRPSLIDAIERYEWRPWSDTEATIHYRGGRRARFRQAPRPETMEGDQELIVLNERGEPAQRLLCRLAVRPDPGGARLVMDIAFERIGPLGPSLLLEALLRPLLHLTVRAGIAGALRKAGAFDRYEAEHGPAQAAPSVLGMRLSWTALALAVIACGWWAWSFGPWLTLALVVGLVLHEAGHVAVMRAFGDRSSAFYLIPFLGGVAIGRMPHAQDWQHAAMVLGGPAAGLASALGAALLGWLLDEPFLLASGYFFALINLINMAPVPPLDGGQLTMLSLRPFLPEAALQRVGSGLIAAGLGIAAWRGDPILIGLFAVMLAFSLLRPTPAAQAAREALARRHAAGLVVITLGLVALLAGLMALLGAETGFAGHARALVRGPFAG
jgi:Zn-dependent protease